MFQKPALTSHESRAPMVEREEAETAAFHLHDAHVRDLVEVSVLREEVQVFVGVVRPRVRLVASRMSRRPVPSCPFCS